MEAAYGFRHSVAMRTKPINTEAVIFFPCTCSVEALDFSIWSCSLRIRHYHIFNAKVLVLSRC